MLDAVGGPDEVRIIASGGTATTFAAVAQQLPVFDRERVHGYMSELSSVQSTASDLLAMPMSKRCEIPCLEPGRARVLPAGLLILAECLEALGFRRFTVTTRGLRYGLVKRMAAGELEAMMVWA
jgi:exopolyphosphatase/guanosine-5'-triphosphate,3'-diphosphate pyrophosphatase